jgi:hypothetical protein
MNVNLIKDMHKLFQKQLPFFHRVVFKFFKNKSMLNHIIFIPQQI